MPATKQSAEASTKPASQTGRSQLGKTAQVVSIVAGALIAAFAIVYCLGCIYFYDRFWPNTVIGDAVISGMTQEDAVKTVDRASKARTVTVSGQGVTFTLNGASAGLEINAEQAVESAISQNSCWQWPVQLFLDHDESSAATASFDLDLLRSAIEGNIAEFNSIAVEPTDAFLYFDENTGRFEINPGSMGTKLDVDSVMQTIMEALANRSAYAALTSVNLVQQGTKSDEYLTRAVQDVGALQMITHANGELREEDGQVVMFPYEAHNPIYPNYRAFIRALKQVGYEGYINYEFCHMPFYDGKVLGYDYVDEQVRLAQRYFRELIAQA